MWQALTFCFLTPAADCEQMVAPPMMRPPPARPGMPPMGGPPMGGELTRTAQRSTMATYQQPSAHSMHCVSAVLYGLQSDISVLAAGLLRDACCCSSKSVLVVLWTAFTFNCQLRCAPAAE